MRSTIHFREPGFPYQRTAILDNTNPDELKRLMASAFPGSQILGVTEEPIPPVPEQFKSRWGQLDRDVARELRAIELHRKRSGWQNRDHPEPPRR